MRVVTRAWLALCLGACSSPSAPTRDAGTNGSALLSREQLMKPETCRPCHQDHYREWASSMHAYASLDPVFIAMNKRGQRETDGAMGDFCVRCHAPMALREGATTDGLNLDELPQELKGVTCYFCHAAVRHEALSNNGVVLEEDGVMRGPYRSAVDPGVHGVEYSSFHDPRQTDSSALCGSCHDVVTPKGVHIERTFAEYKQSFFAREEKIGSASCQTCHMEAAAEDQEIAQMPGTVLPKRKRHSHLWPAVDLALTDDFPGQDVQRKAVECELSNSLNKPALRATDPSRMRFEVSFETNAGHAQPSGAAQDRRMWIEAVAYDNAGNRFFESGVIADDEIEEHPEDSPRHDPFLSMFRDRLLDAQGQEVHMFWEAEASPDGGPGYKSDLVPVKQTAGGDHFVRRTYSLRAPAARFEVRVRMRPVGMDVLRSLVESRDLDESVLARVPTFTLVSGTWEPTNRADPVPLRHDKRCIAGEF
ncbi:MAG TPA: multiheme c-type cytochrome [Polyangiales bacterium]